ncbi:MAG: hypothetical protein QOJ46_576 [bacterium]|jgi:hypothetical protein
MSAPPPWLRPFSLACGPPDARVLDAIVGAHGRGVAAAIVSSYGARLSNGADGLLHALGGWPADASAYETAWDPAFGRAQEALSSGRLDPIEVSVRLALRLTEMGSTAHWNSGVTATTFRLGSLVLADVDEISVSEGGTCVRARTSGGRRLQCVRDATTGRWTSADAPALHTVGPSGAIALLDAAALPSGASEEPMFDDIDPLASIPVSMLQTIDAALDVLAASAPDYLAWVEGVLRGLVICRQEEQFRLQSGSREANPGMVHVSCPIGTYELAEVLVHESAHQYFYLVERAGSLDDGSDTNLYWSPPMRCERPLGRILVAYHALANVLLLYRLLGYDERAESYVAANERPMTAVVAALDRPLRGNAALTALGRGLYEPLAQRLETAGIGQTRTAVA